MTRDKVLEILFPLLNCIDGIAKQGVSKEAKNLCELSEALSFAIKKMVAWISVETCMPFDDRDMLVSTKDKDIFIASWDADRKIWLEFTSGMLIDETDVVAWMPLPDPYEVPDE